ncbi:addiction module component [Photobacterium profundum]|uniref:Pyridoxamine 5'-phosphate oxidase n=1 Tax=Photobacterium profundum 3TCK TaxID=314280 RepID=Q1ZAX8_9GAMM|nr:pyridoxamine 5'-phosphate oxidase [Photobacterium profundum 3TCK]PSV63445.1 addiction module component [Photobacterium profundum]
MKPFTITYVIHPHFNIPFKFNILANSEIDSIKNAEETLNTRHPEGVSIVTSNEQY